MKRDNRHKWRIRQGPEGEWLLYPPGTIFPVDARRTFEKAIHFFPIIAKQVLHDER